MAELNKIGRIPVARGSKVPPWPIFNDLSKDLIFFTTSLEVQFKGLLIIKKPSLNLVI